VPGIDIQEARCASRSAGELANLRRHPPRHDGAITKGEQGGRKRNFFAVHERGQELPKSKLMLESSRNNKLDL
jgi:hypothetical protein